MSFFSATFRLKFSIFSVAKFYWKNREIFRIDFVPRDTKGMGWHRTNESFLMSSDGKETFKTLISSFALKMTDLIYSVG